MTFYTTDLDTRPARESLFKRFITFMAAGIEAHSTAMSRRDKIEALEAKSDAELAKMGIRRDQIAYHVFSDLFYA